MLVHVRAHQQKRRLLDRSDFSRHSRCSHHPDACTVGNRRGGKQHVYLFITSPTDLKNKKHALRQVPVLAGLALDDGFQRQTCGRVFGHAL